MSKCDVFFFFSGKVSFDDKLMFKLHRYLFGVNLKNLYDV